MIHYYFGDGKGKTSAAVGSCLRAAGSGMQCVMIQFFKNGTSSETALLRKCGIAVLACSFQGIRFFSQMTAAEQEAVIRSHNDNLRSVIAGNHQMIILDEFGDAINKNAVDRDLADLVLQKTEAEIIITGHKRTERLLACADYITEFQCIAHPFQNGLTARKGIEY